MTGLAFFVYKRPEYTQKVIEGINRNGFEKVYIFQDGLKNEEDRPLWEKVSELIRGIDFTETEIHISDFNRGLAESIIYGMNYVFERHNTAIALEDDILLADGFKTLMETMFDKYAPNKKVMSICGGGYGVIIPETYPYDVYLVIVCQVLHLVHGKTDGRNLIGIRECWQKSIKIVKKQKCWKMRAMISKK